MKTIVTYIIFFASFIFGLMSAWQSTSLADRYGGACGICALALLIWGMIHSALGE